MVEYWFNHYIQLPSGQRMWAIDISALYSLALLAQMISDETPAVVMNLTVLSYCVFRSSACLFSVMA